MTCFLGQSRTTGGRKVQHSGRECFFPFLSTCFKEILFLRLISNRVYSIQRKTGNTTKEQIRPKVLIEMSESLPIVVYGCETWSLQ